MSDSGTIICHVAVPVKGKSFATGYSTKSELLEAATATIIKVKPLLSKPPWVALLEKDKNCPFKFEYCFSKPYVSPFLCIELKWSVLKNYVAQDLLCNQQRSIATLYHQLQDRLNDGETSVESLFMSCEKNMNNWMKENDPSCPFKGLIPYLDDLPTVEVWNVGGVKDEWYAKAGIDKDSYKYNRTYDNPTLAEDILLAQNLPFDENDIIF